ncbi:DinB family protein [Kurthia massiliensis]|uniref:DinB family protein n=1 Tax=Kurthia massiliensis TaxID=1033739 RepID=UPI000287DF3D|nr:DinB family protein [Kurthia massiliensis]
MYRVVSDFTSEWAHASNGTQAVLDVLTDETLNQAIEEGHNTLGWLGWHLATCPMFFIGKAAGIALTPNGNPQEVPTSAKTIADAYKAIAAEISEKVAALSDEDLLEELPFIQGPTPRGAILRMFIDHQTHHRGQMTVLLRQAGLEVPPVMGPTKEMQK